MKNLVDILSGNGIILKNLCAVDISDLNSRQKIKIFSGVNEKKYFVAVFMIQNKSRFVRNSAKKLLELEEKLESFKNHIYKYKILIISSPLCSQAKSFLKEENWKIIEVQNVVV